MKKSYKLRSIKMTVSEHVSDNRLSGSVIDFQKCHVNV